MQSENVVAVLHSHIVVTTREMFNPLTGNGGSAGNRDFSDGWRRATNLLVVRASKTSENISSTYYLGMSLRGS